MCVHMEKGSNFVVCVVCVCVCVCVCVMPGSLSGEEEYRLSYKYLIKIALSRCSDKAPSSVHTPHTHTEIDHTV